MASVTHDGWCVADYRFGDILHAHFDDADLTYQVDTGKVSGSRKKNGWRSHAMGIIELYEYLHERGIKNWRIL